MNIQEIILIHTFSLQETITFALVAAAALYSLCKLIMLFVPGKSTVAGRGLCSTCTQCRDLLPDDRKNKKHVFQNRQATSLGFITHYSHHR